jgi:ABC-type transport system involved in multi-copper enzyme maturation permease subunit
VNRGLIIKTLRETWSATLLFGIALALFECAISFVLPRFQRQFSEQWLQMQFIQNIIKAMVGTDVAGGAGPEIFNAIPWVHPVVLAVTWAHAIVFCTRVPAGEVDRGTADVLYSLPVRRWTLHGSETAAWLASAAVVLLLGTLGNFIGSSLSQSPWLPARIGIVLLNLLVLYLAVGAFAWLMAAFSDRRGRAIAIAFVIVIASFLLNYLAQFWDVLERIAFLSLLRYYRPVYVLKDGAFPGRDILILASVALLLWAAAGIVSSRRDLTTT